MNFQCPRKCCYDNIYKLGTCQYAIPQFFLPYYPKPSPATTTEKPLERTTTIQTTTLFKDPPSE